MGNTFESPHQSPETTTTTQVSEVISHPSTTRHSTKEAQAPPKRHTKRVCSLDLAGKSTEERAILLSNFLDISIRDAVYLLLDSQFPDPDVFDYDALQMTVDLVPVEKIHEGVEWGFSFRQPLVQIQDTESLELFDEFFVLNKNLWIGDISVPKWAIYENGVIYKWYHGPSTTLDMDMEDFIELMDNDPNGQDWKSIRIVDRRNIQLDGIVFQDKISHDEVNTLLDRAVKFYSEYRFENDEYDSCFTSSGGSWDQYHAAGARHPFPLAYDVEYTENDEKELIFEGRKKLFPWNIYHTQNHDEVGEDNFGDNILDLQKDLPEYSGNKPKHLVRRSYLAAVYVLQAKPGCFIDFDRHFRTLSRWKIESKDLNIVYPDSLFHEKSEIPDFVFLRTRTAMFNDVVSTVRTDTYKRLKSKPSSSMRCAFGVGFPCSSVTKFRDMTVYKNSIPDGLSEEELQTYLKAQKAVGRFVSKHNAYVMGGCLEPELKAKNSLGTKLPMTSRRVFWDTWAFSQTSGTSVSIEHECNDMIGVVYGDDRLRVGVDTVTVTRIILFDDAVAGKMLSYLSRVDGAVVNVAGGAQATAAGNPRSWYGSVPSVSLSPRRGWMIVGFCAVVTLVRIVWN